jgi:membrane protein involved in colicin uptake
MRLPKAWPRADSKKKALRFIQTAVCGTWAFWGAVPPAVKGLGDAAFRDDEDWRSFDFSESTEKKEGGDMSKELQKALEAQAAAEAKAEAAEKAQAEAEAKAKAAEKAQAEAEAQFVEQKEAAKAEAQKRASADRDAKFSELIEAGKAVPGEKEKILAVANALADAQALTFSEGEKETTETAEALFWQLLEGREAHHLLGEFAQAPPDKGSDDYDANALAQKF